MKPASQRRVHIGLPTTGLPTSPAASAAESTVMPAQTSTTRAGHGSFRSAFEEALKVTDLGARPQEIRVRWNRAAGAYTWTVRY